MGTKTFNHMSMIFCNGFHKMQQTDSSLSETLLNSLLFSLLSGNKGEERSKKDEISHSHTLSHFLSDTHKHTSRPVRLMVGLSAAYSELLENAVLSSLRSCLHCVCIYVWGGKSRVCMCVCTLQCLLWIRRHRLRDWGLGSAIAGGMGQTLIHTQTNMVT